MTNKYEKTDIEKAWEDWGVITCTDAVFYLWLLAMFFSAWVLLGWVVDVFNA